jgi:hypothetical protein
MSNIKQLRSCDSDEASPFVVAMAEWANAKAALARNVAIPNQGDNCAIAELDAIIAAEWKLLRTPARTLVEIKERARVVSEMFCVVDMNGRPTDNRHRLMLAALVSEIIRSSP